MANKTNDMENTNNKLLQNKERTDLTFLENNLKLYKHDNMLWHTLQIYYGKHYKFAMETCKDRFDLSGMSVR